MQKKWLLFALIPTVLLLGAGCKAQDEIVNVPTPKPEAQRIVINHELEAPEHFIEVTGFGEVIADPDFATITLGVQASGDTSENASAACTERMQAVQDAAVSAEILSEDMKITGVDITVQQRETDGAVTGYTAEQTITLIVRDVSLSNGLRSALINAGASEINAITYGITDTSAAYQRALSIAMLDAYKKASAIAEASETKLGVVAQAVESPYDDNKLIGVAFESREIAVSAKVTVSYKIP